MPQATTIRQPAGSTAFLTHAPLSSMESGTRQTRAMTGLEPGLHRSRTYTEHRGLCFQINPHLFRRSITNVEELPPLSSIQLRGRSAHRGVSEPISMPRSHVSVARFYDWSEDLGGCFSVSKLYREIANIPRIPPDKIHLSVTNGSNSNSVSINGNRQYAVSPGRMFMRDKKGLTRGEREIIEGIYKNRGDISVRDAIVKSEFQVKNHQEAWSVGKYPAENSPYGRVSLKGERIDGRSLKSYGFIDPDRSLSSSTSDDSSRVDENAVSPKPSKTPEAPSYYSKTPTLKMKTPVDMKPFPVYYASPSHRDTQNVIKQTMKIQSQEGYWDARPSAPPSTPDHSDRPAPTANQQSSPAFDKLLGMRPSLPPNSVLLADKARVHTSSHITHGNSGGSAEPKPSVPRNKLSHTVTPDKETISKLEWAYDDLSVLTIHSGNAAPDIPETLRSRTYKKAPVPHQNGTTSSADVKTVAEDKEDSWNISKISDRPGWAEEQESESEDSERDRKRVKVKVYLPLMGTDNAEEELSNTSLTKERPLSHTVFKSKNDQKMPAGETFSKAMSSKFTNVDMIGNEK